MLDEAERHLPPLQASRSGTALQAPQEFEAGLRVAKGRHREALELFAPPPSAARRSAFGLLRPAFNVRYATAAMNSSR